MIEKNFDFLQAFGQKVKSLRTKRGYSMRAFADIVGVEYRQIVRIEKAEINTSILMAYQIAKALEIPIGELFVFEAD